MPLPELKPPLKISLFSNTTGLPVFQSSRPAEPQDARLAFVSASTPIRGRRLSDVEDGRSTCVDHLGRRMKTQPLESQMFSSCAADLVSFFDQIYERVCNERSFAIKLKVKSNTPKCLQQVRVSSCPVYQKPTRSANTTGLPVFSLVSRRNRLSCIPETDKVS